MRQECKRAPDREVRYVAFKSYHAKPPAASAAPQSRVAAKSAKADQAAAKAAKKPSKKLATCGRRASSSKHKGDSVEQVNLQEELSRAQQKEAELQDALKDLRCENESLKQSLNSSKQSLDTLKEALDASVPLADHHQLQRQLLDAGQQCADTRAEMERLLEQNRALQRSVDELTGQLEEVNGENAELHDRVELTVDKANYLESRVKELCSVEATAASLQSQLEETAARHRELTAVHERATATLRDLQNVVEQQQLQMEDLAGVKRKLRSAELEVQKVVDEKEVSAKFVELMESENASMKQKNAALVEQNVRLGKELVDMKKKMEQLRHKFDDVNKENKVLKEKETRYLIHERINVSKYAKYPSTIGDEPRADLRPAHSSVFRLSNYPAAATLQRRAKPANEFDVRLHHLLHRTDSVDRILKAKLSRRH